MKHKVPKCWRHHGLSNEKLARILYNGDGYTTSSLSVEERLEADIESWESAPHATRYVYRKIVHDMDREPSRKYWSQRLDRALKERGLLRGPILLEVTL